MILPKAGREQTRNPKIIISWFRQPSYPIYTLMRMTQAFWLLTVVLRVAAPWIHRPLRVWSHAPQSYYTELCLLGSSPTTITIITTSTITMLYTLGRQRGELSNALGVWRLLATIRSYIILLVSRRECKKRFRIVFTSILIPSQCGVLTREGMPNGEGMSTGKECLQERGAYRRGVLTGEGCLPVRHTYRRGMLTREGCLGVRDAYQWGAFTCACCLQ